MESTSHSPTAAEQCKYFKAYGTEHDIERDIEREGWRPVRPEAEDLQLATVDLTVDLQPAEPTVEAIAFLEALRPSGPWVLTAIEPDGLTKTVTTHTADEVSAFVRKHDGKRNLYYSVNPTRTVMTKKAAKTDIAAVEYLLADLDPRNDESPEAAKARYLAQFEGGFRPQPTALVDSGNGVQSLWRLTERIVLPEPSVVDGEKVLSPEAAAVISDVEARTAALMRRLGSVAGTQNVDRILRLPGTTNLPNKKKTKAGRVTCPTRLIDFNGATHRLEAFPSIESDDGGAAMPTDFPADIDALPISKRMKDLICGIGDPDHHYESRSEAVFAVTVAMVGAGCPDDQIEAVLLDRQLPISGHVLDQGKPAEYLARQVTKARKLVSESMVLDPQDPLPSARKLIAKIFIAQGMRTLHRHRGTFWAWNGSCYRLADDDTVRSAIWLFLERALKVTKDGIEPFKPKRDHVGNVLEALGAICNIDSSVNPPVWLSGRADLPAVELFACGNGLLHLPTGTIHSPSPDFFCVSASEVTFDPSAPAPTQWLTFIGQLFGDDVQGIELLQDWSGYLLSPDTSQQKILFVVGPKRSGKGTIGRLWAAMLGRESVAGPTMSSLSETFGLEPLITKPLAIISDARIGGRTNKATLVERLLSISGEDRLTVARKFKSAWHGQLPTRLAILTNELPNVPDGSGALAGRLLIIALTMSFFGKEDPALSGKLMTELSGILNWAIKGYRRLQQRGYFIQPNSSADTLESIEMLAAPVKAFVRDCCVIDPGLEVDVDEVWQQWQQWCAEEGRTGHVGSKEWFGRNLRSAVSGVEIKRLRGDDPNQRKRIYSGIGLRPGLSNTYFTTLPVLRPR